MITMAETRHLVPFNDGTGSNSEGELDTYKGVVSHV